MDKELKAKWVAALRSGEYKQIKGRLRDGKNGRCCLGVLCDVAGIKKAKYPGGSLGYRQRGIFMYTTIRGDVALQLTPNAKYQASIQEVEGVLITANDGTPLTGRQRTFEEIADWIEEVL